MFLKSLSFAVVNKIQSSARFPINSKLSVGYQYQPHQHTFGRSKNLQALTFTENKIFIFKRRVSSQSSSTSGLNKMLNYLPFFLSGEIIPGFGRGSKELGIPTANYPVEVVKSLPECFKPGVYYGWANVDNGPVYKMVMNIGWNPFYDNKDKSIETHILHEFNRDLYGCLLKICIVSYLRPEQNFKTLEELIACIRNDIKLAEEFLESNNDYKELQYHNFFLENVQVNNEKQTSSTNSKNSSNI